MNNQYIVRPLALFFATFAILLAVIHAVSAQPVALATDAKIAPIQPSLSVRQALEIAGALSQMNCENKVLKDGAKETQACVPFDAKTLPFELALRIARNQDKIKVAVQTYNNERNRALATAEHKPDGSLTEKAAAEFQTEDARRLDTSSGVSGLDRFKLIEIEPLRLMPGVIAALLPLIDEK